MSDLLEDLADEKEELAAKVEELKLLVASPNYR